MPMRLRSAVLAAFLAALAAPAAAQFRPDPQVVGEDYHVEVAFNFWNATAEPIINSEALGILGTDIDLVDDLGIEREGPEGLGGVVLRPGTKHRFRIDYLPMNYDQPDGHGQPRVRLQRAALSGRPAGVDDGASSRPGASATSTTSSTRRAASSACSSTSRSPT